MSTRRCLVKVTIKMAIKILSKPNFVSTQETKMKREQLVERQQKRDQVNQV